MKNNKALIYGVFVTILLVLIGICLFFMYYFYDVSKSLVDFKELVYTEQADIDYQVKLKDNKYYEDGNDSDAYVTKLLESIDTYFKYTLSFNDKVTGEYSYYILGEMTNYVKDTNDVIYTKELVKTNANKYRVDGKIINISEDFDIKASEYLKVFNDFKKDYSLALDGTVKFNVVINYDVYNETTGKKIKDTEVLAVSYNLGDSTTKIAKTMRKEDNKRVFSDSTEEDHKLYVAIYLEFGGAILLFITLIMLLVKKMVYSESVYNRVFRRIMKNYKSILVEVADVPDLTDILVFRVTNFEDMVDANRDLKIPIMYKEVIKNRETVFIILKDNQAYVYKLSYKELEDI